MKKMREYCNEKWDKRDSGRVKEAERGGGGGGKGEAERSPP